VAGDPDQPLSGHPQHRHGGQHYRVGDDTVRDGQQVGELHQPGAAQREAGDDGTDLRGDVQQRFGRGETPLSVDRDGEQHQYVAEGDGSDGLGHVG